VIESSFTLYKLIILYMLQNVNFPLSNTQISDFILEKEYTNYFHLQEALSELQDTKLIEIEKVRNTSYYHMTERAARRFPSSKTRSLRKSGRKSTAI